MKLLSLLLLTIVSISVFAQDEVILNNGRVKEVYVTEVTPYEVRYRNERLKKKAEAKNWDETLEQKKQAIEKNYEQEIADLNPEKNEADKRKYERLRFQKADDLDDLTSKHTKNFNRDDVFAIIHEETGKEEVVYSPDTLGLIVLDSIREEVDYTVPEMRRFIAGRIDGRNHKAPWITVGGAATGTTASFAGFYSLLVPAAYAIIVATQTPKIQEENVSTAGWADDPAYQDGYIKSAKRKKLRNILISSGISLGVSLAAFNVIFN